MSEQQTRLMKMKNFPPDFFGSRQESQKYGHKQSYSVDRVESRRQRRNINKTSKDSLLSISRTSNQKNKRTQSESRQDKRIVSRKIRQKQVPPFFLKNNIGN